MTLRDLLTDLEESGVRLSARLVVDAPEGFLTPQRLDAMRRHRDLLLRYAVTIAEEDPMGAAPTAALRRGFLNEAPADFSLALQSSNG